MKVPFRGIRKGTFSVVLWHVHDCEMAGVIHDTCMVAADELSLDAVAGARINGAAVHLAAAVYNAAVLFKVLVLCFDVIGIRLVRCGAQLPAQIRRRGVGNQLIGCIGRVVKPVIQIIVYNRRPRTERNLPAEIGEQIHSVVMVVFYNFQRCVQDHPVDQVRKLAHAAAGTPFGLAVGNCQPFQISLFRTERANQMLEGKRFPRPDENAGYFGRRQRQIDRFVFL